VLNILEKRQSAKIAAEYVEEITPQEEFDKLKQVIPELIELGVTNLNLHQLRLTNYNAPKLLKRDYTYLHGEQATVLESELTALKILEFVAVKGLKIGVNYCAFHFKNRFQKAGFRKKVAIKFQEPLTQLTENGYLRSIYNKDSSYFIEDSKLLDVNRKSVDNINNIEISFSGLSFDDHLENHLFLKKIIIGNKAFFLRKGLSQNSQSLNYVELEKFVNLFKNNGLSVPPDKDIFELWKSEFIEWNLREYF